jgi:integrase
MNGLAEALDEYLRLRRALGFALRHAARELPKFIGFLEREGAEFVTTELALQWAQEDPTASSVTQSDRLGMVRRFSAWRAAVDPRTEVPFAGLLPRRYQRPAPYIYSDEEVVRIVTCARSLPSARGLRGLTFSTMYGLLAATGMRVGEAVGLDRQDADLREGVLTIREGKFGKSRIIPLHATTSNALADYAKRRDAVTASPATSAFFVSERGRRVSEVSPMENFVRISCAIGLRPPGNGGHRGRGPRLHDFRHRFAVRTILDWYRSGADVDREMPKLATYLGHKDSASVYWYLQAVPELLEIATERSRSATTDGEP